jgi:hypothetical protein
MPLERIALRKLSQGMVVVCYEAPSKRLPCWGSSINRQNLTYCTLTSI